MRPAAKGYQTLNRAASDFFGVGEWIIRSDLSITV